MEATNQTDAHLANWKWWMTAGVRPGAVEPRTCGKDPKKLCTKDHCHYCSVHPLPARKCSLCNSPLCNDHIVKVAPPSFEWEQFIAYTTATDFMGLQRMRKLIGFLYLCPHHIELFRTGPPYSMTDIEKLPIGPEAMFLPPRTPVKNPSPVKAAFSVGSPTKGGKKKKLFD